MRIDLRSGRVTQRIAVGGRPVALAVGAEAVWVAAEESGSLVRIDPHSGDIVDAIRVGNGPAAVAVGLGAVWTANRQDGTVSRIDPASDRIDPVPAGREPVALTIANGALWVADAAGAVLRLDPRTRTIAGTVRTGSKPAELAAVDGAVWATTLAPATAHRGGTLRVATAPVEVDPELAGGDGVSFPVQWLAYDGLLTYRRAPGAAGTRLVGNLAIRAPEPTDGGLRYVFKLRPGLRYSDGTPVRASDFRASMERMLIVEPGYGSPLYEPIKGAVRCRKAPRACDLSRGIATDDRTGTITIRLNRPDPELRTKLTYPLAVVLPSTTPRRPVGSRPIPGTGPYRVERIGRSVLLARNPYFRPRDGRPAGFADRVAVTTRYGEKAAVAAVERGELDFSLVFRGPAAELSALRTRVGARLQSGSWAMTEYAFLNVRAAPFDDPRVRRALNLAVDRDRVVELTGGPDAGTPTCQLLPPGLPGYRPLCPFTIAPSPAGAWTAANLPEARRLVAASGRRGATVEVWTWSGRESTGRYLAHVLHDLGFRSRVRVFPYLDYGRMPPQIGVSGWFADSPEPGPLLRALVSCDAYRPGDPTATTNGSRFCDPAIDAAIDRAQAAGPAALDAWPRIERRIAAHAPVVPLLNRRGVAVLSRRAGNLQFSPLAGIFLEQLWVR